MCAKGQWLRCINALLNNFLIHLKNNIYIYIYLYIQKKKKKKEHITTMNLCMHDNASFTSLFYSLKTYIVIHN